MLLRVLIVDDNMDAANALGFLIEDSGGCAISYAANGREALAAARVLRPHLVLLDIGLPLLDGYAVAREIRKDPMLKSVKIFAVTGYGTEQDIQRSKEAGIDRHFLKPMRFEYLEPLLQELKDAVSPP